MEVFETHHVLQSLTSLFSKCFFRILKAASFYYGSLQIINNMLVMCFIELTWLTIGFGKILWKMPVKVNSQKISFKRDLKRSKYPFSCDLSRGVLSDICFSLEQLFGQSHLYHEKVGITCLVTSCKYLWQGIQQR